jgi:ribosomal protein S18 acetylase RimI-like enzyme
MSKDLITISAFVDAAHREAVVALWNEVFGYEGAHNDPDLVIDKKLEVRDELFFVALDGPTAVGTIMAGYDGHRGWIYSVAVAPVLRKQGIGSQLVAHAERALAKKGCLKINLQIMGDNAGVAAFYASLGYAVEPRVSMGKKFVENLPKKRERGGHREL